MLTRPDISAAIGYVDGLVGERSRPKLWKYWDQEARLGYSKAKTYALWQNYRSARERYIYSVVSLALGTTITPTNGSGTRKT